MPPHDTYIETHLGGAAVMRAKPRAARSIGIDLDSAAIDACELEGVELIAGDCIAFLEGFDFAAAGRTLIYADPPYVQTTRTSRRRYRFDYTDADHVRLIRCLCELPAGGHVERIPVRALWRHARRLARD